MNGLNHFILDEGAQRSSYQAREINITIQSRRRRSWHSGIAEHLLAVIINTADNLLNRKYCRTRNPLLDHPVLMIYLSADSKFAGFPSSRPGIVSGPRVRVRPSFIT